MTRRHFAGWAVIMAASLAGCATVPIMVPQALTDARTALDQARQCHAEALTPEDFQAAVLSLRKTESAYQSDQSITAVEDSAREAKALAEIAEARARAVKADQEARQLQQELAIQQDLLAALTQKEQALQSAIRQLRQTEAEKSEAQSRMAEEARRAEDEARMRLQAQQEAEMLKKARKIQNALVSMEARGLVINLSGKLLFDTGSSKLQPGALAQLEQVANLLKEFPDVRVRIEGHTDSTGDLLTNNTLSQARAESVLACLNQRSISLDVMTAVGLGSSRPLATNKTPEGRQLNRRVEIILEKKAETPGG